MKSFLLALICFSVFSARAAILVEEGNEVNSSSVSIEETSAYKMREARKVGLGLLAGGSAGLLATQIELNFEPIDGAQVIFGGGSGFDSIGFYWKHLFSAQTLSPYFSTGYTRWYNPGGSENSSQYRQGFISRFLSKREMASGKFGLDFVTGSLGVQYHELQGQTRGLTYFAEASFLYNPEDSAGGLNVGLGTSYLF